MIDVIDNGKGLPKENRHRLLEPYMTTREKGTGLGLPIVGQDHRGARRRLELRDAPGGCRRARRLDQLRLPRGTSAPDVEIDETVRRMQKAKERDVAWQPTS